MIVIQKIKLININMTAIKLKPKEVTKIKTELAILGYMSKKKLCAYLGIPQSNLSAWIRDGFVPEKHSYKLFEFLEKKGNVE